MVVTAESVVVAVAEHPVVVRVVVVVVVVVVVALSLTVHRLPLERRKALRKESAQVSSSATVKIVRYCGLRASTFDTGCQAFRKKRL